MKRAYVSMLCNGDGYVPGVEALGRSLRAGGTKEAMVLMVTADVSAETRGKLAGEGWQIREVTPIQNPTPDAGLLFARFGNVFTKLRAWELTDFDKVVLLDADTIAMQNIDELFDRPEIAAAPDFFLPDRFNSGVMVLDPSQRTFDRMVVELAGAESYDGGDQGFLNQFFPNWYGMPVDHRLPAGYNLHHFVYQFLRSHPSLKNGLEKEVKIIHYTLQKPWLGKPTLTGGSQIWWDAYFGARPEEGAEWKRRLHTMEDWTFQKFVEAITH